MRSVIWPTAGLTVVHVLIVATVMATLIAIAIPTLVGNRQRAFDARAIHDLGNAAAAEVAYYAEYRVYKAVPKTTGTGEPTKIPPGFTLSETVTIEIKVDGDRFTGTASSKKGSGRVFVYDSVSDTLITN